MRLSPFNAWLTRWTFRHVLLRRAYTGAAIEAMVATSAFGACRIETDGISFDLHESGPIFAVLW